MPCEVPHHIGTTIQSLSVAGPLLAEAGAFLGDVGLLWPVTLAWGLSISFAKTFFKLRTNQRLLLLKLPSSLLHRSKTCIVIWWLPHSPLLFLHYFFKDALHHQSLACLIPSWHLSQTLRQWPPHMSLWVWCQWTCFIKHHMKETR